MSTHLCQGVVLKEESYRDYDRKLTIYTAEWGKVSAVARGAKRITSKLNPHLGFFAVIDLMLADGRAVQHLAGASVTANYRRIQTDAGKVVIASYFLEAVNLLVRPNFKDEAVFAGAKKFFQSLDTAVGRREELLVLNQYLFELLDQLGYRPELKSANQLGLLAAFNKLITEIAEREVKSYRLAVRLFD